ncbi:SPOCS domain-containing protein [Clostridium sp.]|uniref:SPOCS domain-containing protein n=1 Tax=Clostridium sp. TaxID=1506 RepID=UPI003216A583
MYCKCNHGYNYQVVGLCDDPSRFDTQEQEPWTQIIVPEILQLPDCYPDIEDLERIYINVKIESARVIETPSKVDSSGVLVENAEGTTLTGRKLLVDGIICQTIVYTADTCVQSLHSVNFQHPFCTYIVIPDDETPIELTKYCVDVCVEDVFAKVLNSRIIFKSVALFLKATIAETTCCEEEDATAIVAGVINYGGIDPALVLTVKLYRGSNVFVEKTTLAVATGVQNSYAFRNLCPGTYTVVFDVDESKYTIGTTPGNATVTVDSGEIGSVDVTISDLP